MFLILFLLNMLKKHMRTASDGVGEAIFHFNETCSTFVLHQRAWDKNMISYSSANFVKQVEV